MSHCFFRFLDNESSSLVPVLSCHAFPHLNCQFLSCFLNHLCHFKSVLFIVLRLNSIFSLVWNPVYPNKDIICHWNINLFKMFTQVINRPIMSWYEFMDNIKMLYYDVSKTIFWRNKMLRYGLLNYSIMYTLTNHLHWNYFYFYYYSSKSVWFQTY